MNIWLNPDGTRYTPIYIEQSELHRNLGLYDPNGRGPHYGLYDAAQPSAQRWVDYAHREAVDNPRPPAAVWHRAPVQRYRNL
jgi:hypothetical protein